MNVSILVTRSNTENEDKLYGTVFYKNFEIGRFSSIKHKDTPYDDIWSVKMIHTDYDKYVEEIQNEIMPHIHRMIQRHTEDNFTGVFYFKLKEDYEK